MTVLRTLPQAQRSLIGAWCFADHYGPDDIGQTGGMDVAPHPHTGLQTVSWLFTGEIEHRDSSGVHAMVRPGELNLMTGAAAFATRRCRRHRPLRCTGCSCGSRCRMNLGTRLAISSITPPTPWWQAG